jgi:hypothetical protein
MRAAGQQSGWTTPGSLGNLDITVGQLPAVENLKCCQVTTLNREVGHLE